MNIKTLALVGMLVVSGSVNAALVSRLGGLAYYDTEADLTWLADANYAATSGYDDDGRMNWNDAMTWVAGLTVGGIGGWRLPDTNPVNGSTFNVTWGFEDGSADYGRNISRPGTTYAGSQGSEMANMFYNVLGNISDYDISGAYVDDCAGSCLTNAGPFSNIRTNAGYWSATNQPGTTYNAFTFFFGSGVQNRSPNNIIDYAWAVQSGDVSPVPIPAAAWLFGSALLGLVGIKRRK